MTVQRSRFLFTIREDLTGELRNCLHLVSITEKELRLTLGKFNVHRDESSKIRFLDIDECLKIPCQNNGNCSTTVGNYTCKCVQGFEGKNCERDIDECKESSPCQNGTCENKNGTYKCKCQKGFLGLNCEIEELGCFKDKAKDRTMGDHMLESLRKYIDWRDMSKTVRNCSEIAKRKNNQSNAKGYIGSLYWPIIISQFMEVESATCFDDDALYRLLD
ncbi:notch homolog 2 N-terminal-like protein A [Montipora capricornis]|uniref:notch homolog 2 N-terminal-like protein A n=1 Tax=Montipora capricornis TaxID=246305 RepID=UPI0035F1957B